MFFSTTLKAIAKLLLLLLTAIIVFVVWHYVAYYNRIIPGVQIGTIDVGGLQQEIAFEKISKRAQALEEVGIVARIRSSNEIIRPSAYGVKIATRASVQQAYNVGRSHSLAQQFVDRLNSLMYQRTVPATLSVNDDLLHSEIATVASLHDEPARDIRFLIEGSQIGVLYDTAIGALVDQKKLRLRILQRLQSLNGSPFVVTVIHREPFIDSNTVDDAVFAATSMISVPLTLAHNRKIYQVVPDILGSWIVSGNQGRALYPEVNEQKVRAYVTTLSEVVSVPPQSPDIVIEEGKVVAFTPPKSGSVLEEEETVRLLITALEERRDEKSEITKISLPVVVKKPIAKGSAGELGIVELIGTATTPFTGSPENRRHNIANGTKFLTGILVPPGEEFSTIKSLGEIDNTTGYLPELVIKGDRTIPEFGGGLCQVSTTLFRSALNAGLPITARRNHSYRVGYYEKAADGTVIGPGLDATIYDPAPDFRFQNDTEHTILVSGYIEDDLITFELYGQQDGRVAELDGPHTLSVIPPGEPIIVQSDELEPGERKRLERAHAGGSAIATYTVTHTDGRVEQQTFKSYYRPWPERWIVGSDETESEVLRVSESKKNEEEIL